MDRKTQEEWSDPAERRGKAIELFQAGTKVKSVFCFLVAPKYRGKGIAQSLLKFAQAADLKYVKVMRKNVCRKGLENRSNMVYHGVKDF